MTHQADPARVARDIAAMVAGDGYVTIGYDGNVSLAYANESGGSCSVTGIGPVEGAALVAAAIDVGLLVVDHSTARDFGELSRVVISGPMLCKAGHYDAWPDGAYQAGYRGPSKPREDGRYGSFAYAPLAYWLDLRRAIGCTIHNAPA